MRWTNVTLDFSLRHNLGWKKLLILNFLSLDFERKLRRTLRKGDIDDITDLLSPRALTKCDTNALLMAMEVGHEKKKYSFVFSLFEKIFSLLIYVLWCSCFRIINISREDLVWKLTSCSSVLLDRDVAIIASLWLKLDSLICRLSSFITERYTSGASNNGFLQNTIKTRF